MLVTRVKLLLETCRMNVLLDYLGRWEVEAGMETASDVMKDLLKKGLQVILFP